MSSKAKAPDGRPKGFETVVKLSDPDVVDEAKRALAEFGRTDKFKTGYRELDQWLGGGIGKGNSFESVVLFAPPGVGKSTVALAMVKNLVETTPMAWMMMEDQRAEVSARFISLGGVMETSDVRLVSEEMKDSLYTLDDIADWVELVAAQDGRELFVFDNLQFCFDDAMIEKDESQLGATRRFMKRITEISKRKRLTSILISHTNKDTQAKGLNKILGSSAIAQTATKVIEISVNDGHLQLDMWKSRYTERSSEPIYAIRDGYKIVRFSTSKPMSRNDYE